MISMKHGKMLISAASLLGLTAVSQALHAQNVAPTQLTGHCNYGDCAIFHECTPFHDQQNLAELNRSGIITNSILTPVVVRCMPYSDCSEVDEQVKIKTCERSANLARLVLSVRDINK